MSKEESESRESIKDQIYELRMQIRSKEAGIDDLRDEIQGCEKEIKKLEAKLK